MSCCWIREFAARTLLQHKDRGRSSMTRCKLFGSMLLALIATLAPASLRAQGDEPNPGVEVLTRGPVHEAFAEPIQAEQGRKTLIITKAPPQTIEELPPEEKPAGDNVAWIAGYWAWDDDLKDFLWVSGIWRQIPPGRQWVSGYWNDIGAGFQWMPGFWTSAQAEEITYLPEPPQPVAEAIPPQVSTDEFWVPGAYMYAEGRYRWRGGYWHRIDPNWIWSPAHYVATPGGYVFVEGYWDYPVVSRGVMFAPVYYREPIYRQANYVYSPTVAIDTNLFTLHLFARPRYCHYYFGDYYAASYADVGIYPWFSVRSYTTVGYDPLFSYYRWDYSRHDTNWSITIGDRFHYLQTHEEHRPPHTLVQQNNYVRNNNTIINNSSVNNTTVNNITVNNTTVNKGAFARTNVLTAPVNQIAKSGDSPMQFERLQQRDRAALAKTAISAQQVTQQRAKLEGSVTGGNLKRPGGGDTPSQIAAPLRLVKSDVPKINAQPIVVPEGNRARADRSGGSGAPGVGGLDPSGGLPNRLDNGKPSDRGRGNNSITSQPPVSPDLSRSNRDQPGASSIGPKSTLKAPIDSGKALTPPSLGQNTQPTDAAKGGRDPRGFNRGSDAASQQPSLNPKNDPASPRGGRPSGLGKTPVVPDAGKSPVPPTGGIPKTFAPDNGGKSGFNPLTGGANTDNTPKTPINNPPKIDSPTRPAPRLDTAPKFDANPKSQPRIDPSPKIDSTPRQLPKQDFTPRQPARGDNNPRQGSFAPVPNLNPSTPQPKLNVPVQQPKNPSQQSQPQPSRLTPQPAGRITPKPNPAVAPNPAARLIPPNVRDDGKNSGKDGNR